MRGCCAGPAGSLTTSSFRVSCTRPSCAVRSLTRGCAPLPAVLDPRAGLERDAPKARLDCPDNLVARWTVKYGDVEGAFASASHRVSEHFRIHKGGGHSLEARGVVARFDAAEHLL